MMIALEGLCFTATYLGLLSAPPCLSQFSLLYLVFQTALCYSVVSVCFVDSASPSSPFRPEPAPERGPAAPELAFRRPESARKIHAKSFGP